MKKSFRHLQIFDRDRLESMVDEGYSQKRIAKILKVDKSTISRELKRRRETGEYDAVRAQEKALVLRGKSKYQGMKIEQDPILRQQIIAGLMALRSPAEIAWDLKMISVPSIYKWLYSAFGQRYCRYLCTKRWHRKRTPKNRTERVMIPNKISIHDKPVWSQAVELEGDTFLSPKRAKTTASVFLGSVVGSHLLVGTKLRNLKNQTMIKAVNQSTETIALDRIILDNGIENRGHEHFRMLAYFCDAHAPWQKPRVEGAIGLIRRWFIPKGTDLRTVSEKELQTYINILNHKRRKSLGYRSAYEVAFNRGMIALIPPRVLPEKLHFTI